MQNANCKMQNEGRSGNFDFCSLHFSICNAPKAYGGKWSG